MQWADGTGKHFRVVAAGFAGVSAISAMGSSAPSPGISAATSVTLRLCPLQYKTKMKNPPEMISWITALMRSRKMHQAAMAFGLHCDKALTRSCAAATLAPA